MIKLNNVQKYYGDVKVLDIDTFTFEKGKKYALVGSNGSGKSTLIKILANIEKLDSGKIEINATKLGYLPQTSYGFNMSVIHNVMLSYPLNVRKTCKVDARKLLESLDLLPLQKKNASRLSGGETQKLAIARLLALPRDVLLLDEPTASLDTLSTEKVETLINNYVKDNNATIIFATHSLVQAKKLADFIIKIENGNLQILQ